MSIHRVDCGTELVNEDGDVFNAGWSYWHERDGKQNALRRRFWVLALSKRFDQR